MNVKKVLVSTFAAVGIATSAMVPLAGAQSIDDATADASVTLNDTGTFDAYFVADVSLGSLDVSAVSGGTVYSTLTIKYDDTQAHRGEFQTQISAGDFLSEMPVPYGGNKSVRSDFYAIPAENFRITKTYNPQQSLCSTEYPACPTSPSGFRIGDVGHYGPTLAWRTNDDGWTSATGSLNQTRTVHAAYEGGGTIVTTGQVGVALDVPAGMPGTSYTSEMTLTILPDMP